MEPSYLKPNNRRRKAIIILILSVFALYIAAGFIVTHILMSRYFARKDSRAYFSTYLTYDEVKSELPRREVSFFSGPNELFGAVYGGGQMSGLVVMVQGFGGGTNPYFSQIRFFVERGWEVLVYDGTGINDSGGQSLVNLYQAVEDLAAALDFVQNDEALNGLPIVLWGHSQGGYAVCSILNRAESAKVKAVVSFAGMNLPGDMIELFGRQFVGGFYPLFKPFVYILDFEDFGLGAEHSAVNGINNTGIPVLLIQGSQDMVVPPDCAAITRFMGEIQNPNAEMLMVTEEGRNGHNSVFQSRQAYDYRGEVNASLEAYMTRHNISGLTDPEFRAWAVEFQLDKNRINALGIDLFNRIDEFFRGAISK